MSRYCGLHRERVVLADSSTCKPACLMTSSPARFTKIVLLRSIPECGNSTGSAARHGALSVVAIRRSSEIQFSCRLLQPEMKAPQVLGRGGSSDDVRRQFRACPGPSYSFCTDRNVKLTTKMPKAAESPTLCKSFNTDEHCASHSARV